MFQFFKNLFFKSDKSLLTEQQQFMRDNRMSFEHLLTINGLLVSEFSYLLNHYSNAKLQSFDDFHQIRQHENTLIDSIDLELKSNKLSEEVLTGAEQARINAENLRNIISVISEYDRKFNKEKNN